MWLYYTLIFRSKNKAEGGLEGGFGFVEKLFEAGGFGGALEDDVEVGFD